MAKMQAVVATGLKQKGVENRIVKALTEGSGFLLFEPADGVARLIQETVKDLRSSEGLGGIGVVHLRGGSGMRAYTDYELLGGELCGKIVVYSHARRADFANFIASVKVADGISLLEFIHSSKTVQTAYDREFDSIFVNDPFLLKIVKARYTLCGIDLKTQLSFNEKGFAIVPEHKKALMARMREKVAGLAGEMALATIRKQDLHHFSKRIRRSIMFITFVYAPSLQDTLPGTITGELVKEHRLLASDVKDAAKVFKRAMARSQLPALLRVENNNGTWL